MKFIHIADVHLGAVPDSDMPWSTDRKKEIWSSFVHILDVCNEEKVDLLLIAGDLFNRQPLVRELKEVNYYFSKLTTAQVVIIAGNHDYISARSNYKGFEWISSVHMLMKDTIDFVYLSDIDTRVYGFSYYKKEIKEALYNNIQPELNGKINILLCHGGDGRHIPIDRKKLQESGFDYIAMGHIHTPQVFSCKMAYTGSLEPLNKKEVGERGYVLGEIITDISGNRQIDIRYIPSSIRQYIKVNLTVNQETTNAALVDQVREAIRNNGEQHIYLFTIQGFRSEDIHFDKEALKSLGNVAEVMDETVLDYDFDAIRHDNKDNILGMFIQKIMQSKASKEVAGKALYYGMEALLGARERFGK
jgi:exonuclease SbcD